MKSLKFFPLYLLIVFLECTHLHLQAQLYYNDLCTNRASGLPTPAGDRLIRANNRQEEFNVRQPVVGFEEGGPLLHDTITVNLRAVYPAESGESVNDTIRVTPCQTYFIADILANDLLPCSNPEIRILDGTFPYTQTGLESNNSLYYLPNFDINNHYYGKTDSVRYSVTCDSEVIDTAWVFFQYPPSLDPWLEFETRLDKTCFAVGDTIMEEILLHFHDPLNCNTLNTIYFDYTLSSSMATFAGFDYSYSIIDDFTGVFNIYYKVLTINSGYENTSVMPSGIFGYSPYWRYYRLNGDSISGFSICEEVTTTDCDVLTFPVTHANAANYRLIQRAQLPGAEDAISQNGIFSYISPNVSGISRDSVRYEVELRNGTTSSGMIYINILPCIDSVRIESTMNEECNFDSCKYDGPSILINEVIITPTEYDGAIYGYQCDPGELKGGEWIELYNPDRCNPVDISGYFLGNSTSDSPNCSYIFNRDIGGGFLIPEGTIIPPMGFCVLRGERAAKVDSVRLIENGGNTFVINLVDHFDRFCLDPTGNRFWLPNAGGWFGFYDRDGVPQDAIYWGADGENICADCTPCNPQMAGYFSGDLVALNDFPADRKTRVSNVANAGIWAGNTPKRQPDGGAWTFNDFTPPTLGYCNGICNTRTDSECSGTASALAFGGSGSFSYQWDDPRQQTAETATGLCEGVYYCTVTDNNTGLTRIARAVITNNPDNCPEVKAVSDTFFVRSCRDTTLRIPLLKNDAYTCDEPEVSFMSALSLLGSTGEFVNDTLIFRFRNVSGKDSLQYKIMCDGTKPAIDSAWVFIEIKRDTIRTGLQEKRICKGDSILFGGIYRYETGIYTDTVPLVATGCDSIVTLTLTIIEPVYFACNDSICKGRNYNFNGRLLNEAGVYTDTIPSIVTGCDSIVTLTLAVIDPVYSAYNDSICQGRNYDFNGQLLNEAGVYADTVPSIATGCDSIIILTLSVIEPVSYSYEHSICENRTYDFNGQLLNKTGVYTATVISEVTGCDSIVTLYLTVNPVWNQSEYATICVSQLPYTWRDTTFAEGTTSSTFVFNRATAGGCDSIVTFHLDVQDFSRITLTSDKYVCQDGEQEIPLTAKVETGNPSEIEWFDGSRTPIQTDGTSLKWVMPLEHESTYWAYAIDLVCGNSPQAYTTVYLTNKVYLFLSADTAKVQIGDKVTLTVTPTNHEHGTYRWYDAITGKLLGETVDNTFTFTMNRAGNYAFYVLTDNGYCPEAESKDPAMITVADYFMIPNIITPYNKNGMNDSFMTPREGRPGYRVEIYNRYQQKIFEDENGWNGTYRGKLAEPGTYYYRIFMKDGRVLKGTVEVAKF
ncbi:MAG: gliding motility-associated C-terminal domain-containing protein [Prevotellaceae bacterium]|jgi:gliding motility-associated-like protein|nr:gliding motility-associated C-terminal domain-containing protein [Prevotellaceae bacterium]